MSYDIRKLLDYFVDVVSRYNAWDKKVNLREIEEYLKEVRENKQKFAKHHYEFIEDRNQERWKYSEWHKFPDLDDEDYKKINEALQLRRSNDLKCLNIFDNVINSIPISSAILRFVDPLNYGILSPPVEKILEVRRGSNEITRYKNYLKNIKEIKEAFGFHRIADVDMALYVYALLGLPQVRRWAPKECLDIMNYHESHPSIIKQIRARNLFSEIWNHDKLHMAELLFEIDFHAAGILYGINLEVGIKKLYDSMNIKNIEIQDFRKIVDELNSHKIINQNEKDKLHNAWHIRCACIHGNGVTKNQVKDLKDVTRWVMSKII